MSYADTTHTLSDEREAIRRGIVPAAAAVLVTTIALTVYGAHDFREVLVVTAVIVATTAGVYGFLLPRALRRRGSAGGTALTLSVIAAALTLPAFWSGLPMVLGVAGAMLGYAGRAAASGSGRSIAAVVLGALSTLMYLSIYVMEALAV